MYLRRLIFRWKTSMRYRQSCKRCTIITRTFLKQKTLSLMIGEIIFQARHSPKNHWHFHLCYGNCKKLSKRWDQICWNQWSAASENCCKPKMEYSFIYVHKWYRFGLSDPLSVRCQKIAASMNCYLPMYLQYIFPIPKQEQMTKWHMRCVANSMD